jgi:hypothetical protein
MQSAADDFPSTSSSSAESSLPWEQAAPEESTTSPAAGPGLTGALPWRQGISDPADKPAATEDNLSWLDEVPATTSTPPEPTSSSDLMPWQSEPEVETEAPSSSTDDPDWMSESASPATEMPAVEEAATAPVSSEDFGWMSAFEPAEAPEAEEPASARTDDLSWMNESATPTAAEEPASVNLDELGWLNEIGPAEQASTPEPPTDTPAEQVEQPPAEAPRPAIKSLRSLPSLQPKETPPPVAPAEQPPADAPRPAIRKLPAANQPSDAPATPPADAPRPAIRKLPAANQPPAQPASPTPDYSNMTYEEWEQAQAQADQEPQLEVTDDLLNEVPDWFKSGDASAETVPESPAGDEAAPDWFSNMDLSSTLLVGPETVQNLTATPEPVAPTSDDVPDWFKGSAAGIGDLDFNSMFVSETPAEESKPTGSLAAKFAEIAPELPAEPPAPMEMAEPEIETPASPQESEVVSELPPLEIDHLEPELALPDENEPVAEGMELPLLDQVITPMQEEAGDDWLDMPDFGDLTGSTEVAAPADTENELEWLSEPESIVEPEETLPHAEEMLDWLSDSEETSAAAATASGPATEPKMDLPPVGDVPDWMREMQSTAPPDVSASTEPQPDLAPAEDMPDWMQEMQSASPPAATTSGQVDTADQSDMPDWMRDMAAAPPTPIAEPVENVQQEYDWLADFDPSQGTVTPAASQEQIEEATADSASAAPAAEAAPAGVDIDALLNFAESATESATPAVEAAAPAVDEFDFESELEPVDLAQPTTPNTDQLDASTLDFDALLAAATTTLPTSEAAEMPPAEPPAEPATPPPAASGRLRRLPKTGEMPAVKATEEAPTWVETMKPAAGPVVLKIGDQEVRAEERPANILPDELQQLRERAKAFAQRSAAAPAISTGPLAGVTGAIDAMAGPTQPVSSAGSAALIISDLDARRIKIIQNILGVEEALLQERAMGEEEREAKQAAAGIKPAAPVRSRPKIDRFAITILLALAIVAPFFTGVLNISTLPDTTQLSPVQTSVKDTIEAIPADQNVLVAFEYGPTGAGELDDLARTIIRDIIKHGVHPVVVSTNPTGALHAQSLMQSLATQPNELALMNRTDKPLLVRQDYWVLPYAPGGAIGVRSLLNAVLKNNASQMQFKTDIEGQPSGLTDVSINTMQHNPAFVLTESQEDVRNWVEQYQAAPPNQVKLVLLSSAAASAVSQTYANSAADKHIIGPLVGLRDAMSYQAVRQPLPAGKASTLVDQRWQSIGLATLLAALIILAGAAFNVIRGLQRRGRR